MSKVKLSYRLIPVFLVVSIFFTACDIPDISRFTEQSAEMTRGIRKGVKDTENLINSAQKRDDLYSEATRKALKRDLENYRSATKPTFAALDALDAYLEALNALSQANKKSGENASGAVTAVSDLVTAVSGFTFASSVVNVATGLLTLEEQFRTAKSFKERVRLAAEIVEGVHPARDENGKPIKDKNGQIIFHRSCTEDAADQIGVASKRIKDILNPILAGLTEEEARLLKPLTPEGRREQLRAWKKLDDGQLSDIKTAEARIASYGCGVIDLLKFNIQDLKGINTTVSQSMFDNIRAKDSTILGLHANLVQSRTNIQGELEQIQVVKNLIPIINEFIANNAGSDKILTRKITFKRTLDNLFLLDAPLKIAVLEGVKNCGEPSCGKMLEVLSRVIDFGTCTAPCVDALKRTFSNEITRTQFDRSAAVVISILDTRRAELSQEDQQYRSDLERLDPTFKAVRAELESVRNRRDQLESLLDSSSSALDAWAETHANLRVAVNTRKPLTVSKLASKVREIWGIVSPAAN